MNTILNCVVLLTLARTMVVQVSLAATHTIIVTAVTNDNSTTNTRTSSLSNGTWSAAVPSTTTTTTATPKSSTTISTNFIRDRPPFSNRPASSPPRSPSSHYRQRLYFPVVLPTTSPTPSPSSSPEPPFPYHSPVSFLSFHVPFSRTSPMVSVLYNAGDSPLSDTSSAPPSGLFYRTPTSHPPLAPLPVVYQTPFPTSLSPTPPSTRPYTTPESSTTPDPPTYPAFPLHPSLSYPYFTPVWRALPPAPVRRERMIPSTAPPPPYFDIGTPTNVTAQLGSHAFLSCIVRNLGNQSISWVRSRDSHILTVDRYTFIADQRFQARYQKEEERWTLQVKFVQSRDDGRYECQVSTEPKISRFVYFHVVTPEVHIPGGRDRYVRIDSRVSIKCIISAALQQPQYIFWYQGKERVVAGEGGREIWVEERPGEKGVVGQEERTVGTLIIPRASPRDQGAYTCSPATLPTTSVTLHVLNDEHPAAMYSGSAAPFRSSTPFLLILPLLCWLFGGSGRSPPRLR